MFLSQIPTWSLEPCHMDNESDSSASDSDNDPWEDMNEEPIDGDDNVMPVINIFEMLQNSQFIDYGE